MHVTCSRKAMEVWLSHHGPVTVEPSIVDYEEFLSEQLAANPTIGYKAMCTAVRNAKGVTFKEAPIRTWLAAHKGALPTPIVEAASSSAGPSMALLQLSDFDQYEEILQQQLSESPVITITELREKLKQSHAVSCLERTRQTWLERARASAPKRAIKRGSSDLPTLENLEEHGGYLRGLLLEDATMGSRKLREAIKTTGFLVSERTMRNWLDRYHGKCQRAIIAAPIEGLLCLDAAALRQHESKLLREWSSRPAMTYTQLKEWLEQTLAMTCTKRAMQNFMQTDLNSMEVVLSKHFVVTSMYIC